MRLDACFTTLRALRSPRFLPLVGLLIFAAPSVAAAGGGFGGPFRIYAVPRIVQVCQPGSAQATVWMIQVGSPAPDPVTLSVGGYPSGLSASFDPNPLLAPGTSQLTLSGTSNVAAGVYELEVTGVAVVETETGTLYLDIAASAALVPSLESPYPGEIDVARNPTLRWSTLSPGRTFTVQVATDAAFTQIVFEGSNDLPATELRVPVLEPQTQYYWRVRAESGCGSSAFTPSAFFWTGSGIAFGSVLGAGGAIPDGDPAGIGFPLQVDAPVGGLAVRLDIDHAEVGDLVVELSHVDSGTSAVLLDRPLFAETGTGCSFEDVRTLVVDSATRDATYECGPQSPAVGPWDVQPTSPLAAFDGESPFGTWKLRVSDRSAVDTGWLRSWCLIGGGGFFETCSWPDLAIPDDDPNGVVDAVTLPVSLTDVNVFVWAGHPWVGDLTFELSSTDHGPVRVIDRPGVPDSPFGCDGDDILAWLDDEGLFPAEDICSSSGTAISGVFEPSEPLAAFDGERFSGVWTLDAVDTVAPDSGSLVVWSLGVAGTYGVVFTDGFESGTLAGWSATAP
jgi:subtilisin-like proprotein convertase family protein